MDSFQKILFEELGNINFDTQETWFNTPKKTVEVGNLVGISYSTDPNQVEQDLMNQLRKTA